MPPTKNQDKLLNKIKWLPEHWWLYTAVLVALLPLAFLRDFTPANELRYLSIADESLQTGRWWAFTNHGMGYADKPPLYFWGVMIARKLLGSHQMWFLSLFSIIPALIITEVMSRWTASVLKRDFRIVAEFMLLSCGLFLGMSFILRMDMLMTLFIVLALRTFWRMSLHDGKCSLSQRILFPIWIFLGVFSKGPMGILIPLIATTVYLWQTGRLRSWGQYWSWSTWGILILLCAIWFCAVYAEGGTDYLDNLLVKQTVGRGVNSFHHKKPFWYYLTSMPYTLLPWTFLILGGIVVSIFKRKKEGSKLERYFVTVILSTLVLLSLISSKIQVYLLPAYPFMVYVAAMVCSRHSKSRLAAVGLMIPICLFAVAGLALGVGWIVMGKEIEKYMDGWWLPVACIILVGGASFSYWWLLCRENIRIACCTLGITLLLLVFAGGFTMPQFNSMLGYRALAEKANEISKANGDAPIVSLNLHRPENMDVYLENKKFRIANTESDSLFTVKERCVVMAPRKHTSFIKNITQTWPVGPKYIIVLAIPTQTELK